jgi:hypothetical protein
MEYKNEVLVGSGGVIPDLVGVGKARVGVGAWFVGFGGLTIAGDVARGGVFCGVGEGKSNVGVGGCLVAVGGGDVGVSPLAVEVGFFGVVVAVGLAWVTFTVEVGT